MSETVPQPPPASPVGPPGGAPPAATPPTTAPTWRWSTVAWIGVTIGVGIAIGVGLGLRYIDLQRTWGCSGGIVLSQAGGMIAMTIVALLVLDVLAGLMLLSSYWRRVGQTVLLADSSALVAVWLIAGNARAFGSPC